MLPLANDIFEWITKYIFELDEHLWFNSAYDNSKRYNGRTTIHFDFFNIGLYRIVSFVSNIMDQFPGVTDNNQ